MVIRETNLVVADNSGAKSVRVFALKGGSYRKAANIGDIVICAVARKLVVKRVGFKFRSVH